MIAFCHNYPHYCDINVGPSLIMLVACCRRFGSVTEDHPQSVLLVSFSLQEASNQKVVRPAARQVLCEESNELIRFKMASVNCGRPSTQR